MGNTSSSLPPPILPLPLIIILRVYLFLLLYHFLLLLLHLIFFHFFPLFLFLLYYPIFYLLLILHIAPSPLNSVQSFLLLHYLYLSISSSTLPSFFSFSACLHPPISKLQAKRANSAERQYYSTSRGLNIHGATSSLRCRLESGIRHTYIRRAFPSVKYTHTSVILYYTVYTQSIKAL